MDVGGRLAGKRRREYTTVRGLRQLHASVVLQSGQNVVPVSEWPGGANVSITTDIYVHSLPGAGGSVSFFGHPRLGAPHTKLSANV